MPSRQPSDVSPPRPYGSWPSPLSSERITRAALALGEPRLDGGVLYWLEMRYSERGRHVVMRLDPDGTRRDLSPADVDVRTRAHEYGGAPYLVVGGRLFFVDFATQALHDGDRTLGRDGARYADLVLSPDGRWLVAVEELHGAGAEAENRIVAFRLDADPAPRVVVCEGHDFASSPRFAPDGGRLAFVVWDHPDMPWDATRLLERDWSADGPEGAPREVAGGPGESVMQPRYAPDGRLGFVCDRSGWWNLHLRETDGSLRALCPREAEFGSPHWVFGLSSWTWLDDGRILCRHGERDGDRLSRLDPASGALETFDLPYGSIGYVGVEGGTAAFLGASPTRAAAIVTLDLASGAATEHAWSTDDPIDAAWISVPEAIEFESAGGRRAHAYYYAPRNPECRAPEGERPPLLVKSHGGPTGAASTALNPRIQYWTSRGFAVVDVNYGGSTGYGRAYRELLDGQWGVVDVEDCANAARHLAERGLADPERLAISGGSAGGYTTLCALTFHDVFAAGASHYGIGDLAALARDTHKFESRYTDRLVAPWPEGEAVYRERSPIHFPERLSCPVIFFQGLEDEVVPPNQAEAMVAALAERGLPHAYVAFEGEQHGFRRAENIRTALDGELYFYSRVFGFDVEERPEGVEIHGLDRDG